MANRITEKTITFKNCFSLSGYRKTLPAGSYRVVTEEQLLEGLTFTALRRTQVSLYVPQDLSHPGQTEILTLQDPGDLDAALARDSQKGGKSNSIHQG